MGHRHPRRPQRRPAAPTPITNDPGPFSLADPAIAAGILAAAGFAEVDFTDVHEPVFYGPDIATAYDAVLRLRHAKDLLADLDPTMTGHALERLRATVAAMTRAAASSSMRATGSSPRSGDQTVRHVLDPGHSSSRSDRRPGRSLAVPRREEFCAGPTIASYAGVG